MTGFWRQLSLVVVLIAAALLVNLPYMQYRGIYPEQALMYIANQNIHHFSDLIRVYTEPKFLHYMIPFFRPSGHFLMYQLITPIVGWHNVVALAAINFMLMGLTCYYMVRLYELLFRGYFVGGVIAAAIYLSHPSLALVKISVLHFEFAHTLFLLMGLYYFILFCEANRARKISDPFQKINLLALSLLFYAVSVTFKEAAITLGAVYITYLLFTQYMGESWVNDARNIVTDRVLMRVIALLSAVTISLLLYVTLPWHSYHNPMHPVFEKYSLYYSSIKYLYAVFGLNLPEMVGLPKSNMIWDVLVFPYYQSVIMCAAIVAAASAAIIIFKSTEYSRFKKSLLFLLAATSIFMVIPLGWGVGAPWHYHLALLTIAIIFGFSIEFLCRIFISGDAKASYIGVFISLLICVAALGVSTSIKNQYASSAYLDVPFKLNYNALNAAPLHKDELTDQTLLVVGEEIYRNASLLGAGMYPAQTQIFFGMDTYIKFAMIRYMDSAAKYYLPFATNFNGNLFRWAYERPAMREQIIPYDNLRQATPTLIYLWLRNMNHIAYITYDTDSNWHDHTAEFKKNILQEQQRRRMRVRNYVSIANNLPDNKLIKILVVPGGDEAACQYLCDQSRQCNTVRYIDYGKETAQCRMYR